jgi:hypothetical protein
MSPVAPHLFAEDDKRLLPPDIYRNIQQSARTDDHLLYDVFEASPIGIALEDPQTGKLALYAKGLKLLSSLWKEIR